MYSSFSLTFVCLCSTLQPFICPILFISRFSCPFHSLYLAFPFLQSLEPLSFSPPPSSGRTLTFLHYFSASRACLLTHVSQHCVSGRRARSLSPGRSHTARGTHDDDDSLTEMRGRRTEAARPVIRPAASRL